MFSINQRRFTARRLAASTVDGGDAASFVLCVPVQGMEELIRNVGRTSGRFGSKFPRDHEQPDKHNVSINDGSSSELLTTTMSRRKRKRAPRFPHGIPGLQRVSVGNKSSNDTLFAIQGTVAHLVCRLDRWMDDDDDTEHRLGRAQVTQAFVQSNYWNAQKNIFCPQHYAPPYLTFFGLQTFGHVIAATENQEER